MSTEPAIAALTGPIATPLGSPASTPTLAAFVDALAATGFRQWEALYAERESIVVTAWNARP